MQASDIMTRDVVSVPPATPATEIARILLDKRISAVPVVDEDGVPLGMVSEGDLIGGAADRAARPEWWLLYAAEGRLLDPFDGGALPARDIMASPVVTVTENTDAAEIARLLTSYRIKRVPVLRDGKIVGIVSRADLLRTMAAAKPVASPPPEPGMLARLFAGIEHGFAEGRVVPAAPATGGSGSDPSQLAAADFQHLIAEHDLGKEEKREAELEATRELRRHRVQELVESHIDDSQWRELLHRAREAAAAGEKEFPLLRFPSQLCSDGGRAINVAEPDWPTTLRGEAAELFLRWERDLKPHGFHLMARILDFPGGVPGDAGLFLGWGE